MFNKTAYLIGSKTLVVKTHNHFAADEKKPVQLSVTHSTTHNTHRVRDVEGVMLRMMIMELSMMTQTITFAALNAGTAPSLVHNGAHQSSLSMTNAYK